jgi:SPP1 family predicted phage head-tail adaptor
MFAGPMRNQIQLQVNTPGQDSSGSQVMTWTTVATVWAQVWAVSGQERMIAAQVQASLTHRVRIRYYAGLTTAYRVVMSDGRTFNILFINNTMERNREMILDCLELPGQAAE